MKAASLLLSCLLILHPATVMAADAEFRTQGGGTVHVDPDTNRATITRGGVTAPLWDGTHRMDDGSILIINQGTTVPNQSILDHRERPRPEEED